MATVAETPHEELVPGVTRVKSINTGRLGVIDHLDYDTRHGPMNPDVWIKWDPSPYDSENYSGWWWAWMTQIEIIEETT